ncbi:MAG: hypothetical protein ABIQ11_11560 [Saprospiraceae bacterium]
MLRISVITGKWLTKLTVNAGAGILLFLYIVVFILPHGLVPHSDHDHLTQSGHVDEKDPCHLAIYHPGSKNSCNHKYHFTKDPENCHLCDVVLLRQISIAEQAFSLSAVSYSLIFIHQNEDFIFQFRFSHHDRGPPVDLT